MEQFCKRCEILEESIDSLYDELESNKKTIKVLNTTIKVLKSKIIELQNKEKEDVDLSHVKHRCS